MMKKDNFKQEGLYITPEIMGFRDLKFHSKGALSKIYGYIAHGNADYCYMSFEEMTKQFHFNSDVLENNINNLKKHGYIRGEMSDKYGREVYYLTDRFDKDELDKCRKKNAQQ